MWVLKAKGKTFYVNHVDCNVPWSTKETPDNVATKGSIKVKNCLLVIDQNANATLSSVTQHDISRVAHKNKQMTRILVDFKPPLMEALKSMKIAHTPVKTLSARCGTKVYVCDILNESELSGLVLSNVRFRILTPVDPHFIKYDESISKTELQTDLYEE